MFLINTEVMIKLAEKLIKKWAENPRELETVNRQQGTVHYPQKDEVSGLEHITHPGEAPYNQRELGEVLQNKLSILRRGLENDYVSIKYMPNVLDNIPTNILQAFGFIWKTIVNLQFDTDNADSEIYAQPIITARKFIKFVDNIELQGVDLGKEKVKLENIEFIINQIMQNSIYFTKTRYTKVSTIHSINQLLQARDEIVSLLKARGL